MRGLQWSCLRALVIANGSRRAHSTSLPPPLHFCVVGSGPAGFYTVDRLLKRLGAAVRVDLLDRLPTPFGLVRSGVAPDHQPTKNVTTQFSGVAADPRVQFFGNVTLGKDVSLQELRRLYTGVVLAYGAESDRQLGIPGEHGQGVLSAREFVWWYNGHPDAQHLQLDLAAVRSVAVCGIGNVALDCARILLQPPARLQPTDIADHALAALDPGSHPPQPSPDPTQLQQQQNLQQQQRQQQQQQQSPSAALTEVQQHGVGLGGGLCCVQHVHLVARRGPVQAACTPKELKELVAELGFIVHASAQQLTVSEADCAVLKASRSKRRVVDIIKQAVAQAELTTTTKAGSPLQSPELLSAAAAVPSSSSSQATWTEAPSASSNDTQQGAGHGSASRHLHFQFYRQPTEVLLDDAGSVRGLRVEVTHLITPPGASAPVAVGTGVYEDIDAQLLLVSIGYKSLPVAGAPFDAKSGTIPHRGGRVLQAVGGPLKAAAAGEEQGPQNGISRGGAADAGKREGVTLGVSEELRGKGWEGAQGVVPGLYVVGWLKRGPTGIIGTNALDAEDTVASILEDIAAAQQGKQDGGPATSTPSAGTSLPGSLFNGCVEPGTIARGAGSTSDSTPLGLTADGLGGVSHGCLQQHQRDEGTSQAMRGPPGATLHAQATEGLRALLKERGVRMVGWDGWKLIDDAEVQAGKAAGKVRRKLVSVEECLRVASG
ncbi:hypothetical protein V8C86DRAFT_2723128 [Haematococcus lacustris]